MNTSLDKLLLLAMFSFACRCVLKPAILLLLTGWFCLTSAFAQDRMVEVVPHFEVQSQETEERTFVDLDLSLSVAFGHEDDDVMLYDPWNVEMDQEGNFYVLDPRAFVLHRFDPEGTHVKSFGEGRGEGPGEFLHPRDFAVSPVGDVFVLDAHRRILNHFDPNGVFVTSFDVDRIMAPFTLHRDHATGDLIVQRHGGDHLFARYSADGTLENTFGDVFDAVELAAWAVAGNVAATGNGFVLAPDRASQLVFFDHSDTVRTAVQTMDDVAYPRVEFRASDDGGGGFHIRPLRRFATMDVAATDDRVYVVSHPASEPDWPERAIDVFDAETGGYLRSHRLDISFSRFNLTEDHLFLLSPHFGVRVYKRDD